MDIDPDVRLYTLLGVPREARRRPLATALSAMVGWSALAVALSAVARRYPEAARVSDYLPFFLSLRGGLMLPLVVLLVVSIIKTAERLVEFEGNGILDDARLCARPAYRLLGGMLVGGTWPLAVNAALGFAAYVLLGRGNPASAVVLVLAAATTADAVLLFIAVHENPIVDGRVGLNAVLSAGFILYMLGVGLLLGSDWDRTLAFDGRRATAALAAAAGALPGLFWLAQRRLRRSVSFGSASVKTRATAALIPRAGPPELLRMLRGSVVLAAGDIFIVVSVVAIAVALVVSANAGAIDRLLLARFGTAVAPRNSRGPVQVFSTFFLYGIPYAAAVFSGFAASAAVQRQMRSGTIDLIKLTPQRTGSIVLSWYAGAALPFWIAGLLTFAIAAASGSVDVARLGWLPAIAVAMPAISLLTDLEPAPVSWALGALIALCVLHLIAHINGAIGTANVAEFVRAHATPMLDRLAIRPGHLDPAALMPMLVAGVCLSAGAGRLRRPTGPSLQGFTAVAGVFVVAVSISLLPATMFPRMLAGLLAIFASFAAEERIVPSPPWRRVAASGIGAVLAGVCISRRLGFDWTASLTTGCGAALACGAGLLVHEATWTKPALSFTLRASMYGALLWFAWWPAGGRVEIASLLWREVAVMAAAFVAAGYAHARRSVRLSAA